MKCQKHKIFGKNRFSVRGQRPRADRMIPTGPYKPRESKMKRMGIWARKFLSTARINGVTEWLRAALTFCMLLYPVIQKIWEWLGL